jgi:hypothetical protein
MSILGTIVSDLRKAGSEVKNFVMKVAADAPTVVQKVASAEASILPVVEAFIPGAATVHQLGDTLLDKVAQAVEDAGSAAGASGLSVSFDQALVADVQAVIAAAKAFAARKTS